jgi:hypothetical protein
VRRIAADSRQFLTLKAKRYRWHLPCGLFWWWHEHRQLKGDQVNFLRGRSEICSICKLNSVATFDAAFRMSGVGAERKSPHGSLPASIGGIPENICSSRVFPWLTQTGHCRVQLEWPCRVAFCLSACEPRCAEQDIRFTAGSGREWNSSLQAIRSGSGRSMVLVGGHNSTRTGN